MNQEIVLATTMKTIGVYKNGELVRQDFPWSFPIPFWIRLGTECPEGVIIKTLYVDEAWFEEQDELPHLLSEIKWSEGSKNEDPSC